MNRHPFDPVSFVLGVFVTGIGMRFLFGVHDAWWVAPAVLVGLGVTLIAVATQRILKIPSDES